MHLRTLIIPLVNQLEGMGDHHQVCQPKRDVGHPQYIPSRGSASVHGIGDPHGVPARNIGDPVLYHIGVH